MCRKVYKAFGNFIRGFSSEKLRKIAKNNKIKLIF